MQFRQQVLSVLNWWTWSDVNARRSWVIKCEVTFSWPRKDAVPCHVLNVSTFLSTKLLERGLAVKDKHVRTEAVIGWMRSLALQVSAWTLSEDGDLVCSCDQTELLYHSVPFTCKVGFHSSVIVCSWYPSLDKYISYTEMNDLSVAWAIHKWTVDGLCSKDPLGYIFLHVTVFRQHCMCVKSCPVRHFIPLQISYMDNRCFSVKFP